MEAANKENDSKKWQFIWDKKIIIIFLIIIVVIAGSAWFSPLMKKEYTIAQMKKEVTKYENIFIIDAPQIQLEKSTTIEMPNISEDKEYLLFIKKYVDPCLKSINTCIVTSNRNLAKFLHTRRVKVFFVSHDTAKNKI